MRARNKDLFYDDEYKKNSMQRKHWNISRDWMKYDDFLLFTYFRMAKHDDVKNGKENLKSNGM